MLGDSGAGSTAPARTLTYTSPADFRTAEFSAQTGLGLVQAETLYYNGHYRWYVGDAPDPAAGTGIGVKIAVADTGINRPEGSTGSVIAIDVANSYDFVKNAAGSGADDYGHGTNVAGIMAAPKNGSGMHGLAFNATLINFKIGDSVITASDAQRADMMRRALSAGAFIINNSWGSETAIITAVSAEQLQSFMPRMIDASRTYIASGGVVVFAAGNTSNANPTMEAGLPYRVPELQPGWLAVVAVDPAGTLAAYSNRCGVAAAWCLAAPGGTAEQGIYSMDKNGAYTSLYGTSMAAPHAAAALAALKSMFTNLSYLQIRDRLLYTAKKSGSYADANVYGQGLMDLAAASSPVDGLSIPTGSSATGPTAPLSGSAVELPAGSLRVLSMQRSVLVVDNYQRAPFWVPAHTFFREAPAPRVIERHWATLTSGARAAERNRAGIRFSYAPGLHQVASAALGTDRLGLSTGIGGEAILGSHLRLAWLPQLTLPAVDSIALGYAADLSGIRLGLVGTLPGTQGMTNRTLESSNLGSRRALGLVAQRRTGATTYGLSFGMGDHFERPIGITSSGAFRIGESAAFSSGAFVQQSVGRDTLLKGSLELARHSAESEASLAAPAYTLRSASFGAQTALGSRTTATVSVKREWSGSEAARLHVPLTIAESGAIGTMTYALPYQDLVGRTAFSVRVDHALTKQMDLRLGITRERQGFGAATSGFAALLEIAL